jgi:aryl-alcohol dehydrogenase-like predicted oxidoreductase
MTCKYNGWVRPSVYQGMYNIITRSIEPELIPACRRYGLDIVVYNVRASMPPPPPRSLSREHSSFQGSL